MCRVMWTFIIVVMTVFAQNEVSADDHIRGRYIKVDQNQKNKICMVNDFYNPMADFSKFSITVKKGGAAKRYYGCCHGCKKALRDSTKFHHAVYLVKEHIGSKNSSEIVEKTFKVDKAEAKCILADKHNNGRVYYFSNDIECDMFLKNPDNYTFLSTKKNH